MKVAGIKKRSPQLPYWLAQIGGKKRRERHRFETVSSQPSNMESDSLFHHGFKLTTFNSLGFFFFGLFSSKQNFLLSLPQECLRNLFLDSLNLQIFS